MSHVTHMEDMGWLRLVGSLKLQVSFAEYHLFYRALLQKRPIILRSLQVVATPYLDCCCTYEWVMSVIYMNESCCKRINESCPRMNQSCHPYDRYLGCLWVRLKRVSLTKNLLDRCVLACVCCHLCVRVCVSVYVRVCLKRASLTKKNLDRCVYMCVCACVCVLSFVCVCTCVCLCVCVCVSVCVYIMLVGVVGWLSIVNLYMYMSMCIYIYVHIYMYAYLCMYIYIYTIWLCKQECTVGFNKVYVCVCIYLCVW